MVFFMSGWIDRNGIIVVRVFGVICSVICSWLLNCVCLSLR